MSLYEFHGDAEWDYFGHSVSCAGDVNGDGRSDLIIGAWGDDGLGSESGSASVLSGADGSELLRLVAGSAKECFGYSVNGAGDVDGDGLDDVIVGAPRLFGGAGSQGSARVYSGRDGSLLFEFIGGDYFGFSVDGAGGR